MQRRLRNSMVSTMAASLLLLGIMSQSQAQWTVTSPASGTTFTPTSRVSGFGNATANNSPAIFSFSYFNDAGAEMQENSTTLTSYEMGPGVFRWITATNELAPPAGGEWKKTVTTMGQNGIMVHKYLHYANIDGGGANVAFTNDHKVY